jgi:hypothetical protein
MPPHNGPSWRDLVENLTDEAVFGPPLSEDELAALEGRIGLRLPRKLRELLAEADGLKADHGSGVIWSAAEIERQNREFRADPGFRRLYMPFDHLLLIGDDAGGDHFAFPIRANGQIRLSVIFRWDHETDSRSMFAAHLEQYLEKRLGRG